MRPSEALAQAVALAAALATPATAFYIPGWSIRSYPQGAHVPLLVNKVYSDHTELQYGYYDLPFVCQPTGQHAAGAGGLLSGQSVPLNLGEVLRGDRIRASDMELSMGTDQPCASLCTLPLTRAAVDRARDVVAGGYVAEWIVDNLPGATSFVTVDKTRKYYAAGFKLGYHEQEQASQSSTGTSASASSSPADHYYLNNHFTIVIRHRRAPGRAGERGEQVVVGFEVYPKSIGPGVDRDETGCPVDLRHLGASHSALELLPRPNATADGTQVEADDDVVATVPYTYSVYFREDESIEWAHRWDLYFVNQEDGSRVHWLAIVNSLVICGLLTGVVMVILARTVRTDIRGYKEAALAEDGKLRRKRPLLGQPDDPEVDPADEDALSEDEDDVLEDVSGWKKLHGDVFRPPAYAALLAPAVGSGLQLLVVAAGLVVLGAVGVLNPSFRGGFVSVGAALFILAGLLSGYLSARVYRTLHDNSASGAGLSHTRNALITALLFPGLALSVAMVLNLFVWAQASSTAIPFGTMLALLALWLCVQVPLVYAGSHYGFHRAQPGAHHHPSTTPSAGPATPVPAPAAWWARPLPTALAAGLVPFAVIFVELLYILQSTWQDKSGYYYVFGFLAVACAILAVAVAEVSLVAVYLHLCAGNHRWWWLSFAVGAGSSPWIFAYSAWYYAFRLHIHGFVSGLLFFAYSALACAVYALLTGTIGFLSAYAFVRRIYG